MAVNLRSLIGKLNDTSRARWKARLGSAFPGLTTISKSSISWSN